MGKIILTLIEAGAIVGAGYLIFKAGQMRATQIFIDAATENGGSVSFDSKQGKVTITIEPQ